jgi:tetratricopeptide (TPR) repeat protein
MLFTLLGVGLATAAVQPAPLPGPNTGAIRPTSTGSVRGFVVDAQTRHPLTGARIRLEEDGTFGIKGPTTATTGKEGAYTARGLIGRSWSKIDWMRVATSFPPLLLLRPQSALRQSRTILATRLNVRVERDGYLPFVGEVGASRLDAGRFVVHMDDIWLAPIGSGLTSFSPDNAGYEWIESFRVTPAVARPGETVTVEARVHIPFERGGRYRVLCDSSEPALIKSEQYLNPVGSADPATGATTFRRTLRLPRTPGSGPFARVLTTELSPWISLDYHEVLTGSDFRSLLQVIRDDAERAPADQVAAGYAALAEHNAGEAALTLARATTEHPKYAPAFRYLGEVHQSLGRTEEAATAYERLVALEPANLEGAWTRYVAALLDGGHADAAAKALETAQPQAKRLPASVALARARVFARRGDLRAADEELAQAGRRGRIPREVQREIALRRAEAALRAQPESPDAELALARALGAMDRLEEAARHARRAQSLRPDEPWPLVELAALERRLRHDDAALAALERALALDPANADAYLARGELRLLRGDAPGARSDFRRVAERRPYEFAARHGLALAELRAGDHPSALQELQVAAVIGRGKGESDPGFEISLGLLTTLYLSPKRHTIAGFDRRDAAGDYQLATALQRIEKRPDDALAQFNAGTALVRLRQPELALPFLDKAAAKEPQLAELPYWRALALAGLDRTTDAHDALEEALRQNPLHPHAHAALARLCLTAGDVADAQAHLAAHRRNWPHERAITTQGEE